MNILEEIAVKTRERITFRKNGRFRRKCFWKK